MEDNLPYDVTVKYNYIKINGIYQSYWYIRNYTEGVKILDSLDKLLANPNIFVDIFIKRLNSGEFLKKITNKLAVSNSEKKQSNREQVDIDILNKVSCEARDIRYLIQVENEDIFEVTVFLGIASKTELALNSLEKIIKNELFSCGINIMPLNFRQLKAHNSTLPTLYEDKGLHDLTSKIFTTSSLTSMFPLYTRELIQREGIYVGQCNGKTCMLDFRKKDSNNMNMIVLGSSGAGKSYFIKNMILQYLYKGVKQVVLDPEGEYVCMAKSLGQQVVDRSNFNIMEFEEEYAKKFPSSFLNEKINAVAKALELENILNSDEKVHKVMDLIWKLYAEKDITEDIESLYRLENGNQIFSQKKFIKPSEFPQLKDLIGKLEGITLNKTQKQKLVKNIKYFDCKSTEECQNDLIVYDISAKDDKFVSVVMDKLSEYFLPNHAIYIDELWQIITLNTGREVAFKITEMFKAIRKQGAGIVAITQDITDVLNYDNASFGKSILNNSFCKVFFKMEYLDIDNLKKIAPKEKEFYERLKGLNRGSALIDYGGDMVAVNVEAFAQDREKILGGNI